MIMFKINNVSYWSETGSEQQSLMLVRGTILEHELWMVTSHREAG